MSSHELADSARGSLGAAIVTFLFNIVNGLDLVQLLNTAILSFIGATVGFFVPIFWKFVLKKLKKNEQVH